MKELLYFRLELYFLYIYVDIVYAEENELESDNKMDVYDRSAGGPHASRVQ